MFSLAWLLWLGYSGWLVNAFVLQLCYCLLCSLIVICFVGAGNLVYLIVMIVRLNCVDWFLCLEFYVCGFDFAILFVVG